ncbi:hypothetical protein [Spiroplasma tabanidicola]|uniref:Uncharacterized protein n=1 Tax=Spiroplasma tabanidicola TaxID=324079 RepID=A0A6I6C831_9MOLU|nr:hypothetical protein [Spiroplasma tabanidicola]QGS51916.1 hypothetical protein STABA_v1c05530 [Spiroplasma tabanidicola]
MINKEIKSISINKNTKDLQPRPEKAASGKFVKKPPILEDKSTKLSLVMQSRTMLSAKKGKNKGDISTLPPGVIASIKNKERINKELNLDWSNNVEAIKQKYDIDGKPLTRKRAQGIIEERKEFFEKNRKKSIKAATTNVAPKPAVKKTATKKSK